MLRRGGLRHGELAGPFPNGQNPWSCDAVVTARGLRGLEHDKCGRGRRRVGERDMNPRQVHGSSQIQACILE